MKLKNERCIIDDMLVMRLFRIGKINQPSFKIVVTEKTNPPRGGRFVEQIGFYNPVTKEKVLNKERAKYWLSKGVQPSPTVYNMLLKEGVLEGKKIAVHKKSKKTEVAPAAAPASAEATAGKPAAPEEIPVAEAVAPVETPTPVEVPTSEPPKPEESPK